MVEMDEPGEDHLYVTPPEAVNNVEVPKQMVSSGPAFAMGSGLMKMDKVTAESQPKILVKLFVNKVSV
jgi:hypothetical protein